MRDAVENIEGLKSLHKNLIEDRSNELSVILNSQEKSLDMVAKIQNAIDATIEEMAMQQHKKRCKLSLSRIPDWIYLIILSAPLLFCVYHYYANIHEVTKTFIPENDPIKEHAKIWIFWSAALGAVSALAGGLIAAYVSKSEDWKKFNSLGALLRFWGAVGALYALYLTAIFAF